MSAINLRAIWHLGVKVLKLVVNNVQLCVDPEEKWADF